MATRSLNVLISGDAKPLGIASKQAEGHIKNVEGAGVRMGKTLALGFATAGAAAAGALVVGLKKSVDAAKEAEVSQAKLKAQLQASGISYRAHAKEIDAVIQKHSQLAGVDDEDLQDAFTGLVRTTGSVSKSMHDMGLVTDIARAKHIDVTKAADLLGKVHAGNTAVLKRYGIAFDPVTKAQDKLKDSNVKATAEQVKAAKAADKAATSQKAIAELQKRFGGQAEAYGKTAAGASDRFHVALENVEEKLGKGLLPVLAKVTGGIATFLAGIDSGRGAGGRFASTISTAFNTVRTVIGKVIGTVRGYLAAHREDVQSVIQAFQRVAAFAKTTWQETLLPIVRRTIGAIKPIVQGISDLIRGVIRTISGLLSGNWSKAWDGAKEAVSGAWRLIKTAIITGSENIGQIIKDLGPKLVKLLLKGLANLGKALATGIWEGIKAAAKAVPSLAADALAGIGHAITSAIQKGLGKINIFGGGLGKGDGLGVTMSIPAFGSGGSLMGANPALAPVAGIASRFGLHTSSGLRPGAITRSNNISFHASGEALDEAGTPSAMAGFFNYMKNTMGSRLAELIYTGPGGGTGIKDGRPYTYTGQVAADHHDHVHTAIDLGTPGPGIGDGPGRRSRADEMGWLTRQWQKVASVFGLDPGKRPLPSLFKHIRLSPLNAWVGVTSDPGAKGHGTDELLWPAWLWRSGGGQKALDEKTKLKLFIHEMTHRFQSAGATNSAWKGEGGAEAFARLAMDRFFGGYKRASGDPYSGYVTRVMRDLGTPWVLDTQFGRKPGTGDGLGRFTAEAQGLRNGPKPPMSRNAVAALAESVGLPGITFADVARGESGYDPDNVGHDPGGTVGLGLWQITTKWNDDIIAKYGGVQAMFDPHKNALAARDVWRRQGRAAWKGTRYVTGWDLHYKGGSAGSGGSGGSGGSHGSGGGGAGSGGSGHSTTKTYTATVSNPLGGRPGGTLSATGPGAGPAVLTPGEAAHTYQGGIDAAELARADAGDDPKKLLAAIKKEIKLKAARLKKVRRSLKRRLTSETRSRLAQEAAQLVADLRELRGLAANLGASVKGGAEHVDPGTGLVPDTGSGDTGSGDNAPDPYSTDLPEGVRAAEALARLTPNDLSDDIAAAGSAVSYFQGRLAAAQAAGDQHGIIVFANALADATEALKGLQGSIDAANELQRQRDDLDRQLLDNQLKILALAQQGPEILAAVIAAINGGIGGRLGLGLQTPSYAGGVANYGSAGRL